jgi:glycine betaine/proline transport system substrate-binding protein
MKRKVFVVMVVIALFLAFGTVAQAEKKEFKFGVLQWNDLSMPTQIAVDFLARFGYKVTQIPFYEWGIAYAALAKGDIDALGAQVDYVSHDYWTKNREKLEKLSPYSHGLYQGLVVPSYVTINSIEELNANKAKFDNKIVGIEPGSGLMRQSHSVVKEYGLQLTLVDGSTPAMTAALKSAVDQKKWIVVTLWTPSWMVMKWDVKFLADPKGIQEPHQTYFWIGRKGFAKEFPFARELLAAVYVPIEGITQMEGFCNEGLTNIQAAKKWQEQNKALMDRWAVMGSEKRYE